MVKLPDLSKLDNFQFGAVTVSPARRLVSGPAGAVHVEPLVMQVFLRLLDGRGNVVTRTELFDDCWGNNIVGDDSLNRTIASVRRIAANTAPGLFEIETIPRTGYRLIGADVDQAVADGAPISRRMLVGVVATAALVGGIGIYSWSKHGNGAETEELVHRGRAALQEGTLGGTQRSAIFFQRASDRNLSNATALGLLAYSRSLLINHDAPEEKTAAIQAAESLANQALGIDPREPNALVARILLQGSLLDWATTEDRLKEVLAIDRTNGFALKELVALYQAAGRTHDSLIVNEQAIALEPLAVENLVRRAFKYWILGRIPQADMVIGRLRQLWPSNPFVWQAQLIILAFTGRPRAALTMLDDKKAKKDALSPAADAMWHESLVALNNSLPASHSRARQFILENAHLSPGIAAHGIMVLGALKDADAAFQVADGFLLSRGSIAVGQPDASGLTVNDPNWRQTQWLFAPPTAIMRADLRFGPLCDGIGLTEYWRKRGVGPDFRSTST